MAREQSGTDEPDEEEDWTSFSSSDYGGGGYDPWSELEPIGDAPNVDDSSIDDDEIDHAYDVSPAPSVDGLTHLVRIACCDHCIGRIGGRTLLGSTAVEVGKEIRAEVLASQPELSESRKGLVCPLCEDLFDDIAVIANKLIANLNGYEVQRMQIGIQLPDELIEYEEHTRKRYGARGSPALKPSLSRSLGEELKQILPGLSLVSELPDVLALVDGLTLDVKLDHRSLFLYTRYKKLERGIPQTRWPCRTCKGRGCERCEDSGLQYPDSVQALISDPLRELFDAEEHATHSMGREDIDVRCLGRGRPTVIELKSPRLRSADLAAATELVNQACNGRVEIDGLRKSDKAEVVRVKNTPAEKTYRIRFTIAINKQEEDEDEESVERTGSTREELPDEDEIREILQSLQGVELAQRTPKRVSHRRADKIRKRRVVEVSDIDVEGDSVELTIRAQSGTYIKELISSDDGRTVPSVTELLDVDCEVEWLDVLDIHAD